MRGHRLATGEDEGEGPRLVLGFVTRALGDDARARALLDGALVQADLDQMPGDGWTLLDFVRAHVVPRVAAITSPVSAALILEDLQAFVARPQRTPTTAPPPGESVGDAKSGVRARRPDGARLHVVLIDPEPFTRVALARALVQAGWDVTFPLRDDDLEEALTDDVDVVVLDPARVGLAEIAAALRARPHSSLVAFSRLSVEVVTARLSSHALSSAALLAKTAPLSTSVRALNDLGVAARAMRVIPTE